jgi:hypothetical protein
MNPNDTTNQFPDNESLTKEPILKDSATKLSSEDTFSPDYELVSKKPKVKILYIILILLVLVAGSIAYLYLINN